MTNLEEQVAQIKEQLEIYNQNVENLKKENKDFYVIQKRNYEAFIMASQVNKELEKYRGIYEGRDVLIVGGGASLTHYKPLNNTINIGVNRAFKMNNIDFDYLFAQDKFPDQDDVEDFIVYKEDTCKKFYGIITAPFGNDFTVRQDTIARTKNKQLYVLDAVRMGKCPQNITLEPFADLCGTVFSALQFALLTNPKRIILAGFDCNATHLFDKSGYSLSYQYPSWEKIRGFTKKFYEHIEIVSLNPVGLKGLFKDIYTKSFVEANSELKSEELEIY